MLECGLDNRLGRRRSVNANGEMQLTLCMTDTNSFFFIRPATFIK